MTEEKVFDYVGHPECSHNWINNARKQCEWDKWGFADSIKRIKPEEKIKDSNNIACMYICTMCGGEFWSSEKMFKIPHYRVISRR